MGGRMKRGRDPGWRKLPEERGKKRLIGGEDKHEWNIEGEKRVRWLGKGVKFVEMLRAE